MPFFPQLETGAAGQFPLGRRIGKRTIRNTQADGRTWKVADPGWSRTEWRLALAGLSGAERQAIEDLFESVEGRLGSFTFLDPTDNLLAWSEDLGAGAWTKDPYLQLTSNIADPLGTMRASRLTNSGAIPQKIEQSLSIPGWYQYCLSVWVRSDVAGQVILRARTAGSDGTNVVATGTAWARAQYSFKLANADELIHFGIELAVGASAEVFGLQVEAQPGASQYKKTLARNGVYAGARFLSDSLQVTAEGPDQHSCVVEITAQV